MAPKNNNSRDLPAKEQALFGTLMSQYEQKLHKKAVKTADLILKKCPDNGATISMKALVIFHTPPTADSAPNQVELYEAEGLQLAALGVKKDVDSQLCWHILGMLHRSKKDYLKANQCFTSALKCDPHSLQILRDNATLSLHLRNYPLQLANRLTLLQLRPNERRNWVNLALGFAVNGQADKAEEVLEGLSKMVKDPPSHDFEESELNLFRVLLLIESKEWAKALNVLETCVHERRIVDALSGMSYKAQCLHELGRKDEAEDCYRALLEENPDCHEYYTLFLANKGIDLNNVTDETRPKILRSFELLSSLYPRASAPRRIALNHATGSEFRTLASAYLTAGLERGVPSLFSDLKGLYTNADKRTVIGELVEEYRANMEQKGSLSGETDPLQPPTTLLWTYYFLSLHHAHPTSNPTPSPSTSLSLLDKAVEHTPTLPELFTAKARVLKHAGDSWGAALQMEEARRLDGQDRFLNSKAGKYWLRAGEEDRAMAVLGLFTKKDSPSPAADLIDMQCLWFLVENADMHAANGNLGMALKRNHQIQKVFADMDDDQFDFHGYCLRKFTIRAYLTMVEWENDLWSSASYVKAALAASSIYVRIADEPDLAKGAVNANDDGVSAEEKKKAAQKAKKAALKADAAKKAAGGADKKAAPAAAPEPPAPKDEDPHGSKLLTAASPLDEAAKLLRPLEKSTKAAQKVEVWVAIYEVAVRRNKFLQAAKALSTIHALDAEHPELLRLGVDFVVRTSPLPSTLPTSIHSSLLALLSLPSDPSSLPSHITSRLSSHPTSPSHLLAAARALHRASAPLPEVESVLFQLLSEQIACPLKIAVSALTLLETWQSERTQEFRDAARKRWSLARVLDTKEEKEKVRKTFKEGEKASAGSAATNGESKDGDL